MCVQRKRSILLEGMQSGERTTELHQAAAFAKSADVDSGEAELLDQRADTAVGLGVVPGEEHDLPTGGMAWGPGGGGSVGGGGGCGDPRARAQARNRLASNELAPDA